MPMLNLGNLPVEHMTPSYSSEALERAFTILKVIYLKEKQYAIAIKKSLSLGVIVKVEPSEKGRHNVVASVEFETLEVDNHQALAASEYWQDNGFLQVKGVGVDDPLQDEGLAATLYETVATKKDVYIVSDNEQFRPGKALWRKIARESIAKCLCSQPGHIRVLPV